MKMAYKTFSGGIHPEDQKSYSKFSEIQQMPLPKKIVIPLSQHIGGLANPLVKVGDYVKTGQKIVEATGYVSIPMHASVSGTVTAIEYFPHPSGTDVVGIEIESDDKDDWVELIDDEDYLSLPNEEIRSRIHEAGICGMGGAGFPTVVKLTPPADKPIDTVIVNGVECEPYLTADCRLMVEEPNEIIAGLKIVMKLLDAQQGIIGIESNKPQSIKLLRQLTKNEKNIRVDALKLKYPQGAEKQLIYATTKRKVPNKGGLPSSVGVVVDNVATIINIYEAVRYKRPLIERVVTVSGKIVRKPSNLLTRVGTKFSELIEFCEGTIEAADKVIAGGPMMGNAICNLDAPTTKTVSGILLLSKEESTLQEEQPCIRCARCIDVCPSNLMPSLIASSVRNSDFETAEKAGVMDCMKCGCCSYVCPAHSKFIQWVEIGRQKILLNKKK